jgi:hypothetical protein
MGRPSRWLVALMACAGAACASPTLVVGVGPDATAVPTTWQEHWFEHDQLLSLVASDDTVAIYFDKDVDRAQAAWVAPYASQLWKYALGAYGSMGPGRLYVVFHFNRYLGCHFANHYDPSHDDRNVIDCGFSSYDEVEWRRDIDHMSALVVEATNNGRDGSPARTLWGDSKWAEFYRYDMYRGTDQLAVAEAAYALWTADGWTDSFPVEGTHWFRDWFYPLWRDHGGAAVMSRFFSLLARDFPATGAAYARDMNWGEYVHFMSGAAGTDLEPLATSAFGWPAEWDAELRMARADFPGITY